MLHLAIYSPWFPLPCRPCGAGASGFPGTWRTHRAGGGNRVDRLPGCEANIVDFLWDFYGIFTKNWRFMGDFNDFTMEQFKIWWGFTWIYILIKAIKDDKGIFWGMGAYIWTCGCVRHLQHELPIFLKQDASYLMFWLLERSEEYVLWSHSKKNRQTSLGVMGEPPNHPRLDHDFVLKCILTRGF